MITHEFLAELCISRAFGISMSPSLTSAGARIICTLFALVLRICDGGETCSHTVKMFPAPAIARAGPGQTVLARVEPFHHSMWR